MREKGTTPCCGGKCPGHRAKHRWAGWVLPVAGLSALVWFLIRVVPKPSRAAYPCQRVAMPLASGFVIWLVGLAGSIVASARIRRLLKQSRAVLACLGLVTIAIIAVASLGDPVVIAHPHCRTDMHFFRLHDAPPRLGDPTRD